MKTPAELVGWVLDPRGYPSETFLHAWVENPPYAMTPSFFRGAKDLGVNGRNVSVDGQILRLRLRMPQSVPRKDFSKSVWVPMKTPAELALAKAGNGLAKKRLAASLRAGLFHHEIRSCIYQVGKMVCSGRIAGRGV